MKRKCNFLVHAYKEAFNWTKHPSDYKNRWLCVMLCVQI